MKTWSAKRIKQLRIKKGLTQAAFAKEIRVSREYINHLEKKRRKPSKTLELIFELTEKAISK